MIALLGTDVVGDREQQRHRHRRADAGEHADGGAEQHAEGGEEQVGRRQGGLEAVEEEVHHSTPSRMPARDRDAEPDVEAVEGADREGGADREVAHPGAAAEHQGGAGEQQRSGDRPAEPVDQGDVEHEDAASSPTVRQSAPPVRSTSSPSSASGTVAARGGEGEQRCRAATSDGADHVGEGVGLHRLVGEAVLEAEGVVEHVAADDDEERRQAVLGLVDQPGPGLRWCGEGGAHASPSSFRVSSTRASCSSRKVVELLAGGEVVGPAVALELARATRRCRASG